MPAQPRFKTSQVDIDECGGTAPLLWQSMNHKPLPNAEPVIEWLSAVGCAV